MTEQTPSQAEGTDESGEIQQERGKDVPRTTPSQAEGERDDEEQEGGDAA
ncbi:hypothetical protein QFZ82_000791 [Streptomyces sp. V4I23]|nr:hypothetical protein [Streptomyces sp. V4I23]MDQ1006306.1 hypothetical protein [Streptomyces sp. V4I23]